MTEILQHFVNFIHCVSKHHADSITNVETAIDTLDRILDTVPSISTKKFEMMYQLFEELVANRNYFSMLTLAKMYDCLVNQI